MFGAPWVVPEVGLELSLPRSIPACHKSIKAQAISRASTGTGVLCGGATNIRRITNGYNLAYWDCTACHHHLRRRCPFRT